MSRCPRPSSNRLVAGLVAFLTSLLAQPVSATTLLCKGYGWTEEGTKREYATFFSYDAVTLRVSMGTFHGQSQGDLKSNDDSYFGTLASQGGRTYLVSLDRYTGALRLTLQRHPEPDLMEFIGWCEAVGPKF